MTTPSTGLTPPPVVASDAARSIAPPPLPRGVEIVPVEAELPAAVVYPRPVGFLQKPWVQDLLPLITSIVAHAVIILIGATAVKIAVDQGTKILQQEQTIIPEASLAESGPPGGVPNVGASDDPLKQAMQDADATAGTPSGFSERKGPSLDASAGGGPEEGGSDLLNAGAGANSRSPGFSSLGASGAGQGGPLAMFGSPGGGGIGPQGPVFGNGGNARKIVFICDATGTMIPKMFKLKRELRSAIQGLRVIQAYNVVFFTNGSNFSINDPSGLIIATTENKRKTYAFLDDKVVPTGETDPVPAIQAAFKQQPELVYFLSDGEFDDLRKYSEVEAEFRKANPGSKIKVNTILFDTFDKEAEAVMKRIAQEHGGHYRYVKESSL